MVGSVLLLHNYILIHHSFRLSIYLFQFTHNHSSPSIEKPHLNLIKIGFAKAVVLQFFKVYKANTTSCMKNVVSKERCCFNRDVTQEGNYCIRIERTALLIGIQFSMTTWGGCGIIIT